MGVPRWWSRTYASGRVLSDRAGARVRFSVSSPRSIHGEETWPAPVFVTYRTLDATRVARFVQFVCVFYRRCAVIGRAIDADRCIFLQRKCRMLRVSLAKDANIGSSGLKRFPLRRHWLLMSRFRIA